MTDEINDLEIQRRRTELESKKERIMGEDKERANAALVDRLARRDYEGVLKLASKYGITIPQEHLLNAAKYVASVSMGHVYSVCGDYDEIHIAKEIYQRFGLESEAKAVEEYIAESDRIHEMREFDKTWR